MEHEGMNETWTNVFSPFSPLSMVEPASQEQPSRYGNTQPLRDRQSKIMWSWSSIKKNHVLFTKNEAKKVLNSENFLRCTCSINPQVTFKEKSQLKITSLKLGKQYFLHSNLINLTTRFSICYILNVIFFK